MRPPMRRVDYKIGDKVEVCSREEGFFGSYYKATVVSCLQNGQYMVQYKNLLLDDKSGPLVETVYPYELRPTPPRVRNPHEFQLNQKVDAFHNDGWWVGQITSEKIIDEEGHCYWVYFSTSSETNYYHYDQIRVHHEWFGGEWILDA